MQVALKDLELRGAGNLLGAEQAGHIAGVGFDLYLRMIGEAVATFRGEEIEGPTELRLELPVQARIPESYIDSERLRLEAYQKLSAAASATAKDDAIDLVVDELRDRYGEPPAEVEGLLAVARLRRRAAQAGLADVVAMGPNLRIAPGEPARLDAGAPAAPVSDGEAARGRRGARRADAARRRRARRRMPTSSRGCASCSISCSRRPSLRRSRRTPAT